MKISARNTLPGTVKSVTPGAVILSTVCRCQVIFPYL